MERTNLSSPLGNIVPTRQGYLTVTEIVELTDLKIHTVRRICTKLAESKPKEQIHKKNGQWIVLHTLIRYFNPLPERKHYVLITVAPKMMTEPNVLIAVAEFFAAYNHPFEIHYSVEPNKNKNGNNYGFHLHMVTERRSVYQMKKELKTLCEANVDIRDIGFGEKQKTIDYISKHGQVQTTKLKNINKL